MVISDVTIFGTWSEHCGNGKDDDGDGDTDCEDSDCVGNIFNVNVVKEPTCNICDDGIISVQMFGLLNNGEISFDNGVSFIPMNQSFMEFDGFLPGDYDIIARNRWYGCLSSWKGNSVTLAAPVGQPLGSCENGDIESGDFSGWVCSTSSWTKDPNEPNYNFPISPFIDPFVEGIVDNRHRVVSSGIDPYAPLIHFPFSGSYSLLLGNSNTGFEIDRIAYKFIVDSKNKDFTFNYALVLQDPEGHISDDGVDARPFFEYSFYYIENGAKVQIPNGTFKVVSDANDPYWSIGNDVVYKGWSCETIDLSSYIGKEITLEFTVADCGLRDHFGYAYIDGLCVSPEDNKPVPSLELNEIVCDNQEVFADATKSFSFNKYEIEVCRIDGGNEVECKKQITFASFIPVINVGDFLEANSSELVCENMYIVKLTLYNDCSESVGIARQFKYVCGGSTISYPDFVNCTLSNNPSIDVKIPSDNDCLNCTFSWEPAGYLDDATLEEPTIQGTLITNAVGREYSVVATNSLGCEYEDKLTVFNLPEIVFISPKEVVECDKNLDLRVKIVFDRWIDNPENIINISFYDLKGNKNVEGQRVSSSPDRRTFTYKLMLDASVEQSLEVTVNWNQSFVDANVHIGNNCSVKREIDLESLPATWTYSDLELFYKDTYDDYYDVSDENGKIQVENIFNPTLNVPKFPAVRTFEPFSLHSGVTWAKLSIWEEVGGLLFQKEVEYTEQKAAGLLVNGQLNLMELAWDGSYNGYNAEIGVYVWVLELRNCQFPEGQEKIFSGDVTLIK